MNERTKGWPSHRVALGVGIVALGLAAILLPASGSGSAAAREEGKNRPHVSPRFSQALLATQLAMQGERQKSPILMLAAAELVRSLQPAGAGGKELHLEGEGVKEADKDLLQMSVPYLVDRAKAFAKDNADAAALVQKYGEQLSSRGLDPRVAEKLPDWPSNPNDKAFFKVLIAGKLEANGTATIKGIPFVADKIAALGAVGENNDYLTIEVQDEDGKPIENLPQVNSKRLAIWIPNKAQTVTAIIHNNGPEQKLALLANWDKE